LVETESPMAVDWGWSCASCRRPQGICPLCFWATITFTEGLRLLSASRPPAASPKNIRQVHRLSGVPDAETKLKWLSI